MDREVCEHFIPLELNCDKCLRNMKHILETDIPEISEHEILEEERYIISLMVTDNPTNEE